ncbi:MAG: CCA tRNA nucleotidyltransferase [Zestosphaera tikiterensis]|uniref:CCA-adding enzyme n=1 Tax=Zestosphaera tikiterensis TaxID=1973259 RepID=A0A2R7Y7M9_9CREN|nr:MAG: CCA tRNA nucleotidyltransferase [Zestosphaera tikiterensis]
MGVDLKDLLDELRKELRPTDEEVARGLETYEFLKDLIHSKLRLDVDFKVSLEGSFAKGTALKGDLDLDVFILIDKEDLSKEWIEENVIRRLYPDLKKYEAHIKYAAHPYITLRVNNIDVDVVPAYWAKTPAEAKTAVDRTPFHTRFVNSRLTSELRDEVRLLKKFFKGIGVYGAEIKVEGFSGYLTELLTIKYGDFLSVLKAMTQWVEGQVVVVEGTHNVEILRKLFLNAPLIVPDPVDPYRNVASAVSRRSLTIAVLASHRFLEKPSKIFFKPPRMKLSVDRINDILNGTNREVMCLIYEFKPDLSPDIMWGELKKISRKLLNALKMNNFNIIDVGLWSDEKSHAVITFDVDLSSVRQAYVVRVGPSKLCNGSINFLSKYVSRESTKALWISYDGVIKALTRKRYTDPKDFLMSLDKERYLESKDLRLVMISKDLNEVLNALSFREDFIEWVSVFVVKTPAWMMLNTNPPP